LEIPASGQKNALVYGQPWQVFPQLLMNSHILYHVGGVYGSRGFLAYSLATPG
jgi:hypothetical protein